MATEPVGPSGGEESTPVPVAPGPSSDAAPSGSAGGAQAAGATPAAAEGVEVKRSSIKPIQDRPRSTDGTFKPAEKDLQRHELGFEPRKDRNASPERKFPGRSRAPEAPVAAKPGEQAPALPVDPAAEPPIEGEKPKPFKFAGRDWESPEQAEQNFRSLQGQYRPLMAARDEEASKAAGWYQHALGLQEKLKAYESGQAQPGSAGAKPADSAAAPAPSADPDSPFAGIDMGVYQLLAQNDGPHVAAAWLAGEVAKAQTERTEAAISEAIAPFKEAMQRTQENQRITGQVENLYQWAASQQNPDGTPAFSEIGDPQAEREIGEIVGWIASQGMPEHVALGPVGLKLATLLRQDALRQSQAPATQPAPGNPAAAAVAASLLQGRAAQDPVSGPSARTTQPGQPMTREQQVLSDIRSARLPDPDLGFVRRSAPI